MTPSKEELAWLKRNGWRKSKPCNTFFGLDWLVWKKRLPGLNDRFGDDLMVAIIHTRQVTSIGYGPWAMGFCDRRGGLPSFSYVFSLNDAVMQAYQKYIHRELEKEHTACYNVKCAEDEFAKWRKQQNE